MSDREVTTPVIAFDIDGVIRVPNAKPGLEFRPHVMTAEITIRADAYPTLHHTALRFDEDTLPGTHTFSATAVNWIRHLLDQPVEVVWASTWGEHANTYFARPLGLPDLPVATVEDGIWDESSPMWKARQLGAKFPGRPLVWVDDVIPAVARRLFFESRGPQDQPITLVHRVTDRALGFTSLDASRLEDWLEGFCVRRSTPE